jgi:hypothetical protein
VQRKKHELSRAVPSERLAALDTAAETRGAEIDQALVAEAKSALDAVPGGLDGLGVLRQAPFQPVMSVLSPAGKEAVVAHADARRAAILGAALGEVRAQPSSAQGLGALAEMQRAPVLGYLTAEERTGYAQALGERRAAIAKEMLAAPIARLDEFGASLSDLKAMAVFRNETLSPLVALLAPGELQPFERAYQAKRERSAAKALPEFEKLLAKASEDGEGIASIQKAYQDIGPGLPAFDEAFGKRRRQIQGELAAAAVEEICAEALSAADVDKGDAKQELLGLGGRTMTLGDFVCRLGVAEQKVNAYESPGLFGKEHLLKLTTAEGAYLTYTLREAEIAHGKKALVGFKVADANAEKPLSVQEWEGHVAMLLPFDDGTTPSDAFCDALFEKPDDQLGAFDKGRIFACHVARAQPAK